MTKDQFQGQLREVLAAAGTALATWGVSDGHQWDPVAGVIAALVSVTWGVLHHRDPDKPGRLRWSLVRKLANVTGAAVVTYGFVSPEKVDSLLAMLAVIGPMLALAFSFIDNDDGKGGRGGTSCWIFLLASLSLLLPGCGTTFGMDHEGNLEILIPYEALK